MRNSLRSGLLFLGSFWALSALPGFSMGEVSASPCYLDAGTATYNFLVHGSSVGDVTRKIGSDHSGAYQTSNVTQAHFLFFKDQVTESSTGLINKNELSPLAYNIVDTRVKMPVVISFNQVSKLAEIKSNNHVVSLGVPSDIQDNLSYVLALRLALIQGKTPTVLTVLEQDQEKRSAPIAFYFKNLGSVDLTTPLGDLKAIKFSRLDANTGLTYDYWFAPSLNYFLVKTDATQENSEIKSNKAGQSNLEEQTVEIVAETDLLTYVKSTGCVISA